MCGRFCGGVGRDCLLTVVHGRFLFQDGRRVVEGLREGGFCFVVWSMEMMGFCFLVLVMDS